MSSFKIPDDPIRIDNDPSKSSHRGFQPDAPDGRPREFRLEESCLLAVPQVSRYPGNPGNQVPQVDQNNCVKCLLRGGKIVDHLKNTMGYSMRTAEWRYTEWVGIALYNISATKDMLVSALL